jgi:hypothetical protein
MDARIILGGDSIEEEDVVEENPLIQMAIWFCSGDRLLLTVADALFSVNDKSALDTCDGAGTSTAFKADSRA